MKNKDFVITTKVNEEDLETCFIASRELLDDFTIVIVDMDKEGTIKKRVFSESTKRDLLNGRIHYHSAIIETNKSVVGYIKPDKLNKSKVSYGDLRLYKLDLNQERWKMFDGRHPNILKI